MLAIAVLLGGCSGEISVPATLAPERTDDPTRTPATTQAGAQAAPEAGANAAPMQPANDEDPAAEPEAPRGCTDDELDVGATPLQRIGRAQYANAVRDILKVAIPAESLPEDERFGVFEGNIVVPVTDLVAEQYIDAAERTARLALSGLETLVPCDRAAQGDSACARQFIETVGRRTYRRPLQNEELARYDALFTAFAANGYADALRVIVQTMLQSPNFLYRIESMPTGAASGSLAELDAHELAARLSFFLLGTTPDDELLDSADSGELLGPDVLQAQAERLLDDAHLSDTLASFHLQWLELQGLDRLSKDEALFPAFSPELGAAMRDETLRFVDHVWRESDGSFDDLLTAPYSFPEGELLAIYGLDADAAGDDGEPIALDPEQRAGLLTQPAFLASHAHYNQTSPVQRGKVVIRNVLCLPLPDPPPNVNTTPPDPAADATTRQRLLEHQNDPSCANCHRMIDGIGLGFEHFDALGAFRSREAGKAIDATGEIVGTRSADGAFDGAVELAHKLAQSAEAQQCFTKQWFRFALGRPEVAADGCTIERLYQEFATSGRDLRGLLRSIVLSQAFRSKRVTEVGQP